MKKTFVILAASLLGLMLLPLFSFDIQTVEAQSNGGENSYGLKIASPTNTTYSLNPLLLNVSAKRMFDPAYYNSELMYSLDGKANVTLQATATFHDMSIPNNTFSGLASYTTITGAAYLSNLSEGSHYLTVYGVYSSTGGPLSYLGPKTMQDTQTTHFMINDGSPPVIDMLQIQNKTYQTSLPLNFSVDEQVSWMGYNLDGQANITLTGNTTLNGLEYGSHRLVVYANDTAGNMGTTGNIDFIVANPESFSIVPVAAVSVAVLAVVISLLLYRRHRKTRNQRNNPQHKKRRLQTPRHLKNIGDPTEIHDLFSAFLH